MLKEESIQIIIEENEVYCVMCERKKKKNEEHHMWQLLICYMKIIYGICENWVEEERKRKKTETEKKKKKLYLFKKNV